MYSYVARQPIFNRHQKTAGYELLFRDGESNAFPADIDENKATCRLMVNSFMADRDGMAQPGKRCFINFPQKSLIRLLPTLLPQKQVVIEVLETCEPNDDLFLAIRHLNRLGYMIALDDFNMDPRWERFLPLVHIIKLDLLKIGIEAACEFIAHNRDKKLMFLAEKVETHSDYTRAYEAGFHFFQGYYFSRPELLKNRNLKPERLSTLRLLQEVCREQVDFERVEQIIASDLSLSFLLLRYVNTAVDRLKVPISEFKQALVYLGEEKLKVFVSAVATAQASLDKPHELYALSLQRGSMCEILATASGKGIEAKPAFMAGLLSLIDALLDQPLDELLNQLPLQAEIRQALLHRQGPLGQLLDLSVAYEQAQWRQVSLLGQALAIDAPRIGQSYQLAMQWSSKYDLQAPPRPLTVAKTG